MTFIHYFINPESFYYISQSSCVKQHPRGHKWGPNLWIQMISLIPHPFYFIATLDSITSPLSLIFSLNFHDSNPLDYLHFFSNCSYSYSLRTPLSQPALYWGIPHKSVLDIFHSPLWLSHPFLQVNYYFYELIPILTSTYGIYNSNTARKICQDVSQSAWQNILQNKLELAPKLSSFPYFPYITVSSVS